MTVRLQAIQISGGRSPPFWPQFLADRVQDCLMQIGLERTDPARLELLNPLKRTKQGFLDKVVGVGEVARPFRKSA